MKKVFIPFIILLLVSMNSTAQSQTQEQIQAATNADFAKNFSQCSAGVDTVTNFNAKKEFWQICTLDNGNRIIKIKSYNDDNYYQEIYFEKSGDLIYAVETQNYMPINHFTQQVWNAEYFIKNGELVSSMSLGHGKNRK